MYIRACSGQLRVETLAISTIMYLFGRELKSVWILGVECHKETGVLLANDDVLASLKGFSLLAHLN